MTTLSSDRPNLDPKSDLFGHAHFAEQLARSIMRRADEDGLVLALHGPWGSGKTTVLGYVCYYIERDGAAAADKPIVIQFNPWWFSGREDLAQAFLRQLQVVLPSKNKKFERLRTLLGDFAEGIGGLIDLTGVSSGAGTKIGKLLGPLLKKRPKDVPALKAEISKILREAKTRLLVLVDDIDRLDEGETRQLFTVIKALADFPFVTYLLAFDREVASRAIERDSGLPGDRYLEKIIQVPFELPPVDKLALRVALSNRLDEVLSNTPDGLFDASYWTNVYYDGIDPLIRVPRDIVRLTNTLAVTYPSVVGEVNPVDFIAIEAIRVFVPGLYDTVRSNPDRFAGHGRDDAHGDRQAAEAFQSSWIAELPEELRSSTRELIERLFPKTGSTTYGPEWLSEWRRNLRACHPDVFPIYFRLSVPTGAVSRREMLAFIQAIERPEEFKRFLLDARSKKRPDGVSKARSLLERLMDHVQKDIPDDRIPAFIAALLDVGDMLIDPPEERAMFDSGNISRVARPVYHLLKRLDIADRANALTAAIRAGQALATQLRLVSTFDEKIEKASDSTEAAILTPEGAAQVRLAWLERVRDLSKEQVFANRPELPTILAAWRHWTNDDEVRSWCRQAVATDEGLLQFVRAFTQYSKSQTYGDHAIRSKPRLNPTWLGSYVDTRSCFERLSQLSRSAAVPEWGKESVAQFMKEFEMLAQGKNPDGDWRSDDD